MRLYFLDLNKLNLVITILQTKDLSGMSFDLLIPGMMVNARVQSALENGLLLGFLMYFTGTVSYQ